MPKKKKPYVELELRCPYCGALSEVKVWRHRVNEPIPPEWEWEQEVQLVLPGMDVHAEGGEADAQDSEDQGPVGDTPLAEAR